MRKLKNTTLLQNERGMANLTALIVGEHTMVEPYMLGPQKALGFPALVFSSKYGISGSLVG